MRAMSTYDRFTKALRANMNDLMERVARGDDVRATVARFEEVARTTRGELTSARQHLAELELDVQRSAADAHERELRAMEALRAGDEPAARARLSEKMDAEREGREIAAVVSEERTRIRELEGTIRELEDKIGPALDWAQRSKVEKLRADAEKLRAAAEEKAEKERRKREKGKGGAKDAAPEVVRDELEEEALRELSRELGDDIGMPHAQEPPSRRPTPRDELASLKDQLKDDDKKK